MTDSLTQRHLLPHECQLAVKYNLITCLSLSEPILPFPNTLLSAAWHELPNDILNIHALPGRADSIFRCTPPPTPSTNDTTLADDTSLCHSSSRGHTNEEGSLVIYQTGSPESEVAALKVSHMETSSPLMGKFKNSREHDIVTRQWRTSDDTTTENFPSNPDSISSSSCSDAASLSSANICSTLPSIFQQMVDSGIAEINCQGIDSFLNSILGLVDEADNFQCISLVSKCAAAVIKQLSKTSVSQREKIVKTLRVAALGTFREHWKSDGDWAASLSTVPECIPQNSGGLNKAAFMGSLYSVKVATAEDVALCLQLLLDGGQHPLRLSAMHAILSQANDKLCKRRNIQAIINFKAALTVKEPVSGGYIWAPTSYDQAILEDIFEIIERWMVMQTVKRHSPFITNPRVGPRLRGSM